ncbi:hypothetical protein [Borrelia sp. P9F1]|uniref:hypothetical protein n=1 Tax=Borrelia sp. P9F1 TaxID=3058374 RepID=UPI002647521D|nr:hypothetical protein [Borrelia sp. P9F1]WKC58689.1 hypothetical protein QYZ68_05655 [Borrelia sp. P9F1]
MKNVNILVCTLVFMLSCGLCGKVASLEGSIEGRVVGPGGEAEFSASGSVVATAKKATAKKSASVSLSEEEKRFESLRDFMGGAVKVDRNRKNESDIQRYEERRKDFFEWLGKNDPDHSKRKSLVDSMKRVHALVKKGAQAKPLSHEFNNLIGWIKGSDGGNGAGKKILEDAGINTIGDVKTDEQVDALIKAVLASSICDGTALSVFFQKLNDVFNGKHKDESEVLAKLQELLTDKKVDGLFEVLKKRLSEIK